MILLALSQMMLEVAALLEARSLPSLGNLTLVELALTSPVTSVGDHISDFCQTLAIGH